MAVLKMSGPYQRRPGETCFILKSVPPRYRLIAGRTQYRVSLGATDLKDAAKAWPDALKAWEEQLVLWERALHVVSLTPDKAAEIASVWAAWISGGGVLATDGFDISRRYEGDSEVEHQYAARVRFHSEEALRLVKIDVAPDSLPVLDAIMNGVVANAYMQSDLDGDYPGSSRVRPLDRFRQRRLPPPTEVPTREQPTPSRAALSLTGMARDWARTTQNKPRGVKDTHRAVRPRSRSVRLSEPSV